MFAPHVRIRVTTVPKVEWWLVLIVAAGAALLSVVTAIFVMRSERRKLREESVEQTARTVVEAAVQLLSLAPNSPVPWPSVTGLTAALVVFERQIRPIDAVFAERVRMQRKALGSAVDMRSRFVTAATSIEHAFVRDYVEALDECVGVTVQWFEKPKPAVVARHGGARRAARRRALNGRVASLPAGRA